MQANFNLNHSENYTRLPDDQSPYPNQSPVIILDSSQSHNPQPYNYTPAPYPQNQGYNFQGYHNQAL